MKTKLTSFVILLVIISYQFGSWAVNALANPSWLDFPAIPVVAVGSAAFFVALGLQLNNLWKKEIPKGETIHMSSDWNIDKDGNVHKGETQ